MGRERSGRVLGTLGFALTAAGLIVGVASLIVGVASYLDQGTPKLYNQPLPQGTDNETGARQALAKQSVTNTETRTAATASKGSSGEAQRLPNAEVLRLRETRQKMTFSLQDGQQRVILDGDASIGVAFTAIGETTLATLTIDAPPERPVPFPIDYAGRRFEFRVKDETFAVYILRVDEPRKYVELQVSPVRR